MIPHYWKIVLLDHDDADLGDVVTQDGEVIGTWSIDEQGWYMFVAEGEKATAVQAAGLGYFCFQVSEWLEGSP